MDVYLVRHGEAAASWSQDADPGLSALGRQQAEWAAEQLRTVVAEDVLLISSPLRRAVETATPLAQLLSLPVCKDIAFREVPAPVPLSQRQEWLRRFMRQSWSAQGDDILKWRAATQQRLIELACPVVVFTHFLVINAVVGHVTASSSALCFWPANGSITHLRLKGSRLELLSLGEEMETHIN